MKLRLKDDLIILSKEYKKGDEFEVIGEDSIRGLDIKDKDGKCIYEVRFIQDKFETIKN